jgi:hypothetical protein
VTKFFNYDADVDTFTDKTDEVNSFTEAPFVLFASTPAVGDVVYVGSSHRFLGMFVTLSVLGTGSPAIDWEYYNGSGWTDLTETETDSGSSTFTASGKFTWSYPYGWDQNSVNGTTAYWIRGKLDTAYTIAPQLVHIAIRDSVNRIIEPNEFSFEEWGKISFTNSFVPSGTKNVRVDYSYGLATTPTYIVELTVLLASIKAFIVVSGGSYDDATSYTLGTKAVTIGEVYVNVREVLDQYRKRIGEIMNIIGRRTKLSVI